MNAESHQIRPSAITKPIQLLAAWLVGLISINGSFLLAASEISHPKWASALLIITSVVDVPLFLVCLFLLQTKFRPEMQEDTFYAIYLERRLSKETGKIDLIQVGQEEVLGKVRQSPDDGAKKDLTMGAASQIRRRAISPTFCINDFLDGFEIISDELRAHGFKLRDVFGRSNPDPISPDQFLLSVVRGYSIKDFQLAVQICRGHGLDSVSISELADDGKTLYIGSYGYRFARTHELTDDLYAKLMDEHLDWERVPELLPA